MLKTATFFIDFEILWFEKVKLVCHRGFHKCVWSGFLHLVVSYYTLYSSKSSLNIIFREEFQMTADSKSGSACSHNVHSKKNRARLKCDEMTLWLRGVRSLLLFPPHAFFLEFNLNLRDKKQVCRFKKKISSSKWRVISKDIFMWGYPFQLDFEPTKIPM